MSMFKSPALAIAALTFASLATPSLAGSPYYDPMGQPMPADQAGMVMPYGQPNPGYEYAQPNGAGPYSCTLGEKRTRMQRRACGPLKPEY